MTDLNMLLSCFREKMPGPDDGDDVRARRTRRNLDDGKESEYAHMHDETILRCGNRRNVNRLQVKDNAHNT